MMSDRPILTGFRHSVYTRAARIALIEKQIDFAHVEHDPFDPHSLGNPHPFGRVPTLRHRDFTVYETAAITAYADAQFHGPPLMPRDPRSVARVVQVIGIVDAYAYWPLVRQVYSHAVYRPAMGEPWSQQALDDGLTAAPRVLSALDAIAAEGLALGADFTRADCHLAPMIAAFAAAPQGADLLAGHPALATWWERVAGRNSVRATAAGLLTRVETPKTSRTSS